MQQQSHFQSAKQTAGAYDVRGVAQLLLTVLAVTFVTSVFLFL